MPDEFEKRLQQALTELKAKRVRKLATAIGTKYTSSEIADALKQVQRDEKQKKETK